MTAAIQQFFKDNPKVSAVLLVGDALYLPGFEAEAVAYANPRGFCVERVERPIKDTTKRDGTQ